jgi:hypothetical protein
MFKYIRYPRKVRWKRSLNNESRMMSVRNQVLKHLIRCGINFFPFSRENGTYEFLQLLSFEIVNVNHFFERWQNLTKSIYLCEKPNIYFLVLKNYARFCAWTTNPTFHNRKSVKIWLYAWPTHKMKFAEIWSG